VEAGVDSAARFRRRRIAVGAHSTIRRNSRRWTGNGCDDLRGSPAWATFTLCLVFLKLFRPKSTITIWTLLETAQK
jgi:hypothetical protein